MSEATEPLPPEPGALEAPPGEAVERAEFHSAMPVAKPATGSVTLDIAEQVLQEMLRSIHLDSGALQDNPGDHARLINACARLVDSATRLAIARGAANPAAPGPGAGPTLQQLQQIQLSLHLL